MSQENFNPLAEAQARADVGRQVFEQFMEHDTANLSLNERAQGYADFASRLESRPYQDDKGKLHDPITGKFITKEDASLLYAPNADPKTDISEEDAYASMSLAQLAMLSAEAEVKYGKIDKTTLSSVDDAILDKIDAIGLEDEYVESDGTLRDKSELDNYYDRVMKLRDSYVAELTKESDSDKKAEKVLSTPKIEGMDKYLTDEQKANLKSAWEKQTQKDVVQIKVDQPEVNDLQPIIVSDDEIIVDVPLVNTINSSDKWGTPGRGGLAGTSIDFATRPNLDDTQEKKKKSLGKRILGAVAVAAVIAGGLFAANKISNDDNSEQPPATEAPDSGIDIAGAVVGIDDEEVAPTTTPQQNTAVPAVPSAPEVAAPTSDSTAEEIFSTSEQEQAQAEIVSTILATYSPEQRAQMSGDASVVIIAGDVMPSTNVDNANVADHNATMQAALHSYNFTHGTNFVFGKGDMFWNGDHIMNPAELTHYNEILKQTIEEASK